MGKCCHEEPQRKSIGMWLGLVVEPPKHTTKTNSAFMGAERERIGNKQEKNKCQEKRNGIFK